MAKTNVSNRKNIRPWILRNRTGLLLSCWCLTIFILSSIPGNHYPEVQWEYSDKVVHIGLYLAGGVLSAMWFSSRQMRLTTAVLFCVVYGLTDELHQLLVPRRAFSLTDLAADSVGAVIGVSFFAVVSAFRPTLVNQLIATETITESPERMKTT